MRKISYVFLIVAACILIPLAVIAAAGDRTSVTTTTCSGDYCVETMTIYEKRFDGSLVVISTQTRTFRKTSAPPLT